MNKCTSAVVERDGQQMRERGGWLSKEEDIFPKSLVQMESPLVVCIFSGFSIC
jgi:hypothetical protein